MPRLKFSVGGCLAVHALLGSLRVHRATSGKSLTKLNSKPTEIFLTLVTGKSPVKVLAYTGYVWNDVLWQYILHTIQYLLLGHWCSTYWSEWVWSVNTNRTYYIRHADIVMWQTLKKCWCAAFCQFWFWGWQEIEVLNFGAWTMKYAMTDSVSIPYAKTATETGTI